MRTSTTHPLKIAEVQAASGSVGVTFCPGKKDAHALTGAWDRDLELDLDAIKAWGARSVVTLVERHELESLHVPQLGEAVRARGMSWWHLPILDMSIPDDAFEQAWPKAGEALREILQQGRRIIVHCKGGLGRAGMVTARLLVELGTSPEEAVRRVRAARPGAIETRAQLELVRHTRALELPILETADLHRVSGRLGSNPAFLLEDDAGQRYYVKTLESVELANNELLAARLYQLAGAPTLSYLRTPDPCQVATRWLELEKKHSAHFSASERRQAQQWFGVHAWTANWDAVGFGGDNQGVFQGRVITLDVGGALVFRGQGDPKGRAFGAQVSEVRSLRQHPDNPHAAALFGEMSHDALRAALEQIVRLPDEAIRERIMNAGEGLEESARRSKADKSATPRDGERSSGLRKNLRAVASSGGRKEGSSMALGRLADKMVARRQDLERQLAALPHRDDRLR